MSALTKELKVRITADANGLKGVLNGISDDISKVSKDFEGLKNVGSKLSSVGKTLTAGLTLPIVGIGVASTKTASDFQGAMKEVSAISGATGKDLDSLSNLAKEMGSTTKFSASESAEALKYMGMAGWKTQDMMEGLPAILSLAAAGGTDLALTSDIVTDGLTSMGLSAKDTDKFVDIMASTCSNANTSIELMGETLKYVGPVAGSLGIEMDDLSVAIGLMGNAGLKGGQAGTSLRAGLTNLVKPTKEMKNAMEKYGVELVKNADGSVDLMGTMQNLRSTLGELDQTTQAQALASIFGKEAMSGWASIVNASESDFNKLTEAINNSEGSTKKMSDTMLEGSQGALIEMKSALEGVAITIGERLTPFLEKLADGVSKVCAWFQSLSPATQNYIMIIAVLIASVGPLLLIIGSAISLFANLSIVAGALGISVGALVAPFGIAIAIIAAIIAIGYLLVSNWDLIKQKVKELGKNISDKFSEIRTNVTNKVNELKTNVSDKFSELKTNATNKINELKTNVSNKFSELKTNATNKINELKTNVSNKFSEIKTNAVNKFNEIKTGIEDKINGARDAVGRAIEKIKSFFNFSWSLPKLKLPHISISGSFSLMPPSVPKFGIDWYSKGAIFKRPTILGGMGVGDAHNGIGSNAEAILPINQLPKLLGLDKMQNNSGISLNIENFNNNTDKDIEYLANELAFYMSRKRIGGAY